VSSHKFTGKERDAESGLDFFGCRFSLLRVWLDASRSGVNNKLDHQWQRVIICTYENKTQ
jgi:hypothetical protein